MQKQKNGLRKKQENRPTNIERHPMITIPIISPTPVKTNTYRRENHHDNRQKIMKIHKPIPTILMSMMRKKTTMIKTDTIMMMTMKKNRHACRAKMANAQVNVKKYVPWEIPLYSLFSHNFTPEIYTSFFSMMLVH
jgi:hypothetical protein